MESSSEGQSIRDAQNALDVIGDDRARIGARMTAETWWAAPAQGFGTVLLVAGPVAGFQWAWLLFLAATLIFLTIEWVFRQRSGLTISRPAGPRGLALVIGIGLLIAAGLGINVFLSFLGLHGWIIAVAAVTGILAALGVVAYDHLYAIEVRRAR